jgi:phosphatidylglycerol---prolipoprotein diacylglyceryl transferase
MIPEFSLHEIRLGPVHFQVFGVLLTLGVITGHMVLVGRAWAERLGTVWTIEGFALALGAGALIAALIADRLFGVGLSSIGGLAGAIVAGGIYTFALRLDVLRFADAAAYAFPFGWLLARMGCAAVHDHLGRSSSAWIAVRFASGPRLDLGLLEALLTLALLVIAEAARRAGRDRPGAIAAVIAMGYALIRFPLDFLRAEELSGGDPRYAGFTAAQWGCLPLFGLGLVAIALAASAPLSAAIATAGASSQGQPKSNHQR